MHAQCAHCGVFNNDNDKVCAHCGCLMPAEEQQRKAIPPARNSKSKPPVYRAAWAPVAGALLGFLFGIGLVIKQPGGGNPDAALSVRAYWLIFPTCLGLIAGGILWLLNAKYFNSKDDQVRPNRPWRVALAAFCVFIPFVGLVLALWAKRGNRLPGAAKNTADVLVMFTATLTVITLMIIVLVNFFVGRPVG